MMRIIFLILVFGIQIVVGEESKLAFLMFVFGFEIIDFL
jgi:hypothetical protein